MRIRELRDSDKDRLMEMFKAQNFEYEFPGIGKFIAAQVLVDENDIPVLAICARETVELYMVGDNKWGTPRWRFEGLKMIHESMRRTLFNLGIEDANIWIPPQVKNFGRRLERCFGWTKSTWQNYARGTS